MDRSGLAEDVLTRVRCFYEDLPFNCEGRESDSAAQVMGNPIRAYPDLDRLLRRTDIRRVLEVGCGTGWLSNSMALHYGKHVRSIDATSAAIERAKHVAELVGVSGLVRYSQGDLFGFQPEGALDLVSSVGVLHHTHDCAAAFARVASFVPAGGFLFVGLYHRPGREPFLAMFREILARDGEEAAFRHYCSLNSAQADEQFLRSWFRDQVLHPHETQHTLAEVCEWMANLGLELRSTSLNRFAPIDDVRDVIALEDGYADLSRTRNTIERRFFPGFFTVLAERPGPESASAPAPGSTADR